MIDWSRIVEEVRGELARCDHGSTVRAIALLQSLYVESLHAVRLLDPERITPPEAAIETRRQRTDHLVDLARRLS